MDVFDLRLLFSSNSWLMLASMLWTILLAWEGWRDAQFARVNVLRSISLLLGACGVYATMYGYGVVGIEHTLAMAITALVLVVLVYMGLVGWGDALILPGVVLLLGAIGIVALAAGLFVGIMHGLMRRDLGDGELPLVGYTALPACLAMAAAFGAVVLEWP